VFTGISGLGQELAGLRHHRRRVAAAHQRDLQRVRAGLHADAGAARCRRPRRLTTAIIVDQERMAAIPAPRSAPPPTPARCCGSSSAGSGSPTSARPRRSRSTSHRSPGGAITLERGGKTVKERHSFSVTAACVRAARGWARRRHRSHPVLRRFEVPCRGRAHDPGYTAADELSPLCASRFDRPHQADSRLHPQERHDLLYTSRSG